MKTIFLIPLLAFAAHSPSLSAAERKCTLEHFRESATAKASALVCGEFTFDPGKPLPQKVAFEKCGNVAVEFSSRPSAKGVIYSVEMSDPQAGKTAGTMPKKTTLEASALPASFRLVRSVPFKENKHVLSEEYFLDCH